MAKTDFVVDKCTQTLTRKQLPAAESGIQNGTWMEKNFKILKFTEKSAVVLRSKIYHEHSILRNSSKLVIKGQASVSYESFSAVLLPASHPL